VTNRRYTEAERDYIAAHLGREPLATIAAALGRTELGLEEYLKGRRNSAPTPPARCARQASRRDGLTIPELAAELGVDSDIVRRWVRDRQLPAITRYERRRAVTIIARAAVRRFIAAGGLIDTTATPKGPWRVAALVAERHWRAEYISGPELTEALGYARQSLVWLGGRGLPAPATKARGMRPNYYRRAEICAWLTDNPQYASPHARAALGLPSASAALHRQEHL